MNKKTVKPKVTKKEVIKTIPLPDIVCKLLAQSSPGLRAGELTVTTGKSPFSRKSFF